MSPREVTAFARRHALVKRELERGTATIARLADAEGITESAMGRWLRSQGYEIPRAPHPRSADRDRARARELRESTDPPMPITEIARRLGVSKQWVSRLLSSG